MAALTNDQQDAYQTLLGIFNSYDLGTLAPKILQLVQEGHSPDSITMLLQQT